MIDIVEKLRAGDFYQREGFDKAADEIESLRERVARLESALMRAERKLSAYVDVCTGDKELTNTILPMARAALAKDGEER